MADPKNAKLFVNLEASQARRRLKGGIGLRHHRGRRTIGPQLQSDRLSGDANIGQKTRHTDLKRLFDAGLMGRALFVCDRTELRDNGLGDFQAAFGNDAAEVSTKHPQKNARVLIATYQTLDQAAEDDENADATFFLKHYPPDYFDVIVIDECHRSAWGDWFVILEKNANAVQVGLTATPRQIKLPECSDEETRSQVELDRLRLADKLKYFGEAAHMNDYDLFDVIAAVAYGIAPLTRAERAARFGEPVPDWLAAAPPPATQVIRAVVSQFEKAGTDALEKKELWGVDEVKRAGGITVLLQSGNPAELMRLTKETLFAA